MGPDDSTNFDSTSLEEQVMELRSRVVAMEEALRRRGIVASPELAAKPVVHAIPVVQAIPVVHAINEPSPIPAWSVSPPPQPVDPAPLSTVDRNLESRIGSQWFSRIGIVAVLIGMSWFLKLAIDNHWIGSLGRVLIGLLAGAGLIAWSEYFQRRKYAAFSYSLKAVGSGVLYLSLWAAFSLFHLVPAGVAFAAMILVTAFNGFMAWIQDAELLALYSIVGGLSTPLLISTGGNHEVTLLSYLLLLDLAVLVLVALRPWSRLAFGAFTGTVLYVAGWWLSYYSNDQFAVTAIFLAAFFLIFAFAPRMVRVVVAEGRQAPAWDNLVLLLLPIVNAALSFLAFKQMLDQAGATWAAPWLAVGLAAFYLLLIRLPARGILRDNQGVLRDLHLTVAVVFLTIAVPLEAKGRWLTTGWLVQGAVLLWLAQRVRSQLLGLLAAFCLVLGLGALVLVDPAASTTPVFNERFATYCIAIGIFAFVCWLAGQDESGRAGAIEWSQVGMISALIVNVLILIAVGLEIHAYWWYVRWHGQWGLLHEYEMYAQFTYSAFFMAFGTVLLGIGFWRGSAFVRWQALVLLAVAIGKVFLVDVSQLSQGYRILSFLALGVLLLAISFVYQRDWLHLRRDDAQRHSGHIS